MSGAHLRSRSSAAVSLLAPLFLIGLTVLIGAAGTPSFQGTVTLVLCNLIVVLGLQVFIGNSGVYSFGQIGFTAVGAYVAALLTLPAAFVALQTPGLPSLLAEAELGALASTVAAAVGCGLLAAIVGPPLMRTSTPAIPISTFAFLVVTYNVIANWERVTGGNGGLVSIPTTTGVEAAGLWAGAATVVALGFKRSASGYRLQATREDEVAARSIGIGVRRERLLAFGLSAVLCGVGGALAVHQSGVLTPATFYFGATVTTLTMLVFGGARSVLGAVVGAFAVASAQEALRGLEDGANLLGAISLGPTPGLAAIGLALILLATMIAMPDGLSGGREAGEIAWLRGRLPASMASPPRKGAGVESRSAGRATTITTRAVAPPPPTDRASVAPPAAALSAARISVAFGGLRVLDGVDLTLERGETLGLIGPNGAGKTTLVNVLSGFQRSDSGTVRLNGVDVTARPPARLARDGLARTFQAALPFPHLSCLESVAVGAMGVGVGRRRAVAVAADVLARLDLLKRAGQPAGSLPPARQRLLGIARALATRPRYLLLDEPAAGLDGREREELVAILRGVLADFGCGILLIEHEIDVVIGLCRRVQVLDDGATLRIGTPEEVRADPAVVESYLGGSFLAAADA